MSYVTFLCPQHGSAPHRELPRGGRVRWALLRSATAITRTDVLAPARSVGRFGLLLPCECTDATVVVSRQQLLAVNGVWRGVVRAVLRRYPHGACNSRPLPAPATGTCSSGTIEVSSDVRLPGIGSGPGGVRWHLRCSWRAPDEWLITCDVNPRVQAAVVRFLAAHGDPGLDLLTAAHVYGSCSQLLDLMAALEDAFD